MKKVLWTLIGWVGIAMASNAIVIRHDVDKEKYLASWEDFPPLAQFYVDGAHGILISPKWIVTAAHTTFCTPPGATILVAGEKVQVKRRFTHPDHRPGVSHDIALIELESPVTRVKPAKLYKSTDETGKVVTFIGAGGTGTGIAGQTIDNAANNGVLRKAYNTVQRADGALLQFVFHQGGEALPLEGIGGGGDSGGPAYIQQEGEFWVLGVSSRGEFGSTIGKYGNREYYSRVSYFTDWIDRVMNGTEQERSDIALPELKYLMAGLSKETLPEICADIGIK